MTPVRSAAPSAFTRVLRDDLKNCAAPINSQSVGQEGGCNPIPLHTTQNGDSVVINIADLKPQLAQFSPDMFFRLLFESFRRQKRRKSVALLAIALGMTIATAMSP